MTYDNRIRIIDFTTSKQFTDELTHILSHTAIFAYTALRDSHILPFIQPNMLYDEIRVKYECALFDERSLDLTELASEIPTFA